jgi:hypothetical protein
LGEKTYNQIGLLECLPRCGHLRGCGAN